MPENVAVTITTMYDHHGGQWDVIIEEVSSGSWLAFVRGFDTRLMAENWALRVCKDAGWLREVVK